MISTSSYKLPFAACVTCLKYSNCPVHMPGVSGNIKVPHADKCVLDQLNPADLARIADQITSHLGILECQKESLGRKLEMVLVVMEKFENAVVNG